MIVYSNSIETEQHVRKEGSNMSVGVYEQRFSSSSSSGPPPPYSRLPPDGHEFPSSYAEGLPDKLNRFTKYSRIASDVDISSSGDTSSSASRSGHSSPLGPPPSVPRSPPSKSTSIGHGDSKDTPTRASSLRWRRQDEKSERSVRDKIAMFSTEKEGKGKQRKSDTLEPLKNSENSCIKRAFTEDDVRIENNLNNNSNSLKSTLSKSSSTSESIRSSRGLTKTSTFSSMINVSSSHSDTKENVKPALSDVDIRNSRSNSPGIQSSRPVNQTERADTEINTTTTVNGLHERSQSLIDIGKSTRMKRHSVGSYDRTPGYKPEDKERRTSLNNIIEQRRKSMSKLRGLVIPESRTNENNYKPPIDLPKISSIPSTTAFKTMSLPRDEHRTSRLYKTDSISSIDSCESNTSRQSSTITPTWKSSSPVTNPKYSSTQRHKHYSGLYKHELPPPSGRSLARSASPTSDFSAPSPTLRNYEGVTTPSSDNSFSAPSPTLRNYEGVTTPSSDTSFELDTKYSNDRSFYSKSSPSHKSLLDSRLHRTEDSDNDSAVSSTQSSFSQGLSPPSSPMPDNDEQDHKHSSSRSYRPRHSPQSSIDDPETARVLKQGSIEAENRRNVLKSAKCSSGRSSDEQSSTPEIIRKYSGEAINKEKKVYTDPPSFPKRLDSELKEGPKSAGLIRQPSNDSTSSTSSRKSSQDTSRKSSKDSVIHVGKPEEFQVLAEPVYFDQQGEMYKETQVKVAYLNQIVDNFEELNESLEDKIVAEIPLPSKQRTIEYVEKASEVPHLSYPEEERWAALELKYGSSTKTTVRTDSTPFQKRISNDKPKEGFKAIANRWKQREEDDVGTLPPQPQGTLPRRDSSSNMEKTSKPSRLYTETESVSRYPRSSRGNSDVSVLETKHLSNSYGRQYQESSREIRPTNLEIPRADLLDRKLSMPEYGNPAIKMRDRKDAGISSRPTSLIEGNEGLSVFDSDGHYLSPAPPSPSSTSTDSREDLLDGCTDSSLSRTASKEVLDAFSKAQRSYIHGRNLINNSNPPRVSDIMNALERHDLNSQRVNSNGSHPRMSSVDSNGSDEGSFGAQYGSVTSLASGQRDQYGSITSLASSTSMISPQELAQLIEEANQSLEESGTPSHEILVVVLHREVVAHGSIGITLAGGADYETKEITVHKIIPGSIADRDGRIQRGDRVLSINGRNLKGVSHGDALTILKSPRPEVVLVLSRSRSVTPQEGANSTGDSEGTFSHRPTFVNHLQSQRPPKILESPMDSKSLVSDIAIPDVPRAPAMTITLVKDGAGVGFSLEGGKDSPVGDRPLTVKKIFAGGAADKGGVLKVGDEIVSVNTRNVTLMARIEAWNFLKKLPDGTVTLVIRQKIPE